jgi:hypothetical protein
VQGIQDCLGNLVCGDSILAAAHLIGDLGDIAAALYHCSPRDGKGCM